MGVFFRIALSLSLFVVLASPGGAPGEAAEASGVAVTTNDPQGDEEEKADSIDPIRFGTTEETLRARFGDALRQVIIAPTQSASDKFIERLAKRPATKDPSPGEFAPKPVDPYARQSRHERKVAGEDIIRVEYDLFAGKVYAIRWQLAERFERPIEPDLLKLATKRFGTPKYNQFIPARFGSGKVDVRRAGWALGDRLIELRILAPNVGGPVYITVTDQKATKAVVKSRGQVAPPPDSLGPWWKRPAKTYKPVTPTERAALLNAFETLLGKVYVKEPAS